MIAVRPKTGSRPAPLRAAIIARQLLGLVESGYFERTPHDDEQVTIKWLTRAISELDKLRIVREPTAVLDRLDALLTELSEIPAAQPESARTGTSQLTAAK